MGKKASTTNTIGWLTRKQVALLLDRKEEDIAAMDGRDLHPVRGRDRSWLYRPSEIRALATVHATEGEVAGSVFGMFRAGKGSTDVVIESRQPPARIVALREEYDRLSGGVSFDADAAKALYDLAGLPRSVTGMAVVEALRERFESRFKEGYAEGRADGEDFGVIIDPATGAERRVTRSAR